MYLAYFLSRLFLRVEAPLCGFSGAGIYQWLVLCHLFSLPSSVHWHLNEISGMYKIKNADMEYLQGRSKM